MWNFIILGLIPGTHIQISFMLWIDLIVLLSMLAVFWLFTKSRLFHDWFISTILYLTLHQKMKA